MTSKARRSRPDLTEDEVTRTLEAGVDNADQERTQAFEGLRLLRAARVRGRERQLRRLMAVPGGARDARSQAAAAKVEQDRRLEKALGLEAARSSISPPMPDEERWTLHGHVLDESLDSLQGVKVSLVDPRGQLVRGQGGRTDGTGYFKLSVPAPPEEAAQEQPKTPKRSERARKGSAGVIVRVMAGRSRLLFEGDTPLVPVGGAVEYLEILVPQVAKGSARGTRGSRRSISRSASSRPVRKK